ncbi:hypothetical protein E6Q11_03715 [Candidatus Dojkabacteria bacterium]|jgi:hypothetical protein|uniref:PilN domain-containing protein n=1 Tax=Candidatus Dojkabacteria bacterium TaxID=2099670 RepID=A0A5C7J6Y2_9BACT|nr:MAG: hypothetical protein E6Q11_03715 [Candidatus Dojkabacteria bacterium]
MIEVNLIPDVKQELLKARRVRNSVISGAILVSIVAGGIVTLLAVYVFGVQWGQHTFYDKSIKDNQAKIQSIEGASDLLTIQNQLSVLSEAHNNKTISSRLFGLLDTINPAAPNNITISKVGLNSDEKTIEIEGQADNSFAALETFRKTIEATNIEYSEGENSSEPTKKLLASEVTTSDTSFGEDNSGRKVLRFKLSFKYDEALFARNSQNLQIVGPTKRNATDSFKGVPSGLFEGRSGDEGEGE